MVDVLLGRVDPSGKVSETFPLRVEDTPSHLTWTGERGSVLYGEGVCIGYRWYDSVNDAVRYPFGHGLSYTTFDYSDLRVDVLVGASSRDIRLEATLHLPDDAELPALVPDSELLVSGPSRFTEGHQPAV